MNAVIKFSAAAAAILLAALGAMPARAQEAASPEAANGAAAAVADDRSELSELASQVDKNPQAEEVKSGILSPVYWLAERLSFPTFHWFAFALMTAGVVSFALQLSIGKLIVLSKLSLSPTEVLSDALGLAVSLVGLVLTTQAAAENSTFTTSAFAVISATAVGVVVGGVFYIWGQRHELQAVEGRKQRAALRAGAVDHPIKSEGAPR